MNQGTMMKALEWAYDRALDGLPGAESAEELANDYLAENRSRREAADSLVRWQVAKSSASGAATGLGGFATMPLTVPAGLASSLYVQLRMVAAIAHLGGYDVRADQTKTLAFLCLCGDAAKDVAKSVGVQLGRKLTQSAIQRISGETRSMINQAVGFRLLTKFGEKGLVNLGKAIPIVGALVGGAFDGAATYGVGQIAMATFLAE